MKAGLLTVGDELLAGDVENTNATWLASELTERGVTVRHVSILPDERALLAQEVTRFADEYDVVIATGGIGDTPDDITVEAVAKAFDRELVVHERARVDVCETLSKLCERLPDIGVDVDAEATLPAGGRYLPNPEGLSPGCVVENVYVLPGIPSEMRPMFERVADEFSGSRRSRSFYTETPESDLAELLEAIRDEYDVTVGSYPDRDLGVNQIKVTASDPTVLETAYERLRTALEVVDINGASSEIDLDGTPEDVDVDHSSEDTQGE